MKTAATIAHTLVRIAGPILVVLGLLFWTGNALTLIGLHMLLGLILVLSLWTLALLAWRAGVNRGLVALAIVWGFIVSILGITQNQLLPGAAHWVIRVLHLLVGIAAIGQAEALARRIKQAQTPAPQKDDRLPTSVSSR
jgi:hypothetical protein